MAKSALAHVKKIWKESWDKNVIPQEFKDRLGRVKTLPDTMKNMQSPWMPFKAEDTYSLILWNKLTLDGVLCENYTVKRGRMAGLKPELLTPNWKGIGGVEGVDSEDEDTQDSDRRGKKSDGVELTQEERKRIEGIWMETWKLLKWKYRPAKHHEAYWRLLHKRPRRARGAKNVADPRAAFHTGFCRNCGEKDTTKHAYVLCPEVSQIWATAVRILEDLIGAESVTKDLNVQLSVLEIVLGFPELRKRIPKIFRMRVVLWHSAVLYVITACREWSLDHRKSDEKDTRFNYHDVQKCIRTEIRSILYDIFERETALKKIDRFKSMWENSSRFIIVTHNRLEFKESIRM